MLKLPTHLWRRIGDGYRVQLTQQAAHETVAAARDAAAAQPLRVILAARAPGAALCCCGIRQLCRPCDWRRGCGC